MNKKLLDIILVLLIILVAILSFLEIRKIIYQINYNKRISEVFEDDVEIERKWLINKDEITYDLTKGETFVFEQTYISFSPEMRVRRINDGKDYTFTIKTNITEDGMTRDETEFSITEEEYNNLVTKKEGNTIYKTRYQFLEEGEVVAIDIFSGDLEGLAYLEVEFANEEEAKNYNPPSWVIKDVTDDLNYKNGHLARFGIPDSYYEYTK